MQNKISLNRLFLVLDEIKTYLENALNFFFHVLICYENITFSANQMKNHSQIFTEKKILRLPFDKLSQESFI